MLYLYYRDFSLGMKSEITLLRLTALVRYAYSVEVQVMLADLVSCGRVIHICC
jgi:hypothetical protein